MGGLVNTSIRFNDGEIINTLIYTSGINSLFISKAFYDRDKKALKALLKKLRMTTWDDQTFEAVAPYDYGLIVADFMSDTIIDLQGYCSVGKSYLDSSYLNSIKDVENFLESKEYKKSHLKDIVDMFLHKRAIGIDHYDGKERYLSIDKTRGSLELDNFKNICIYLAILDKKYTMVRINYDTRCIITKLQDYDYETYLNLLSSINYPLSEKDKAIFNELIKKRNEDERTYSDPM